MQDCVFCNIVAGQIPSAKVYEDQDVFAFLDIHPVSQGHTLVIPKKHAENVFRIDIEDLKKVIEVGQSLAKRIKEVVKADGMNLLQSNDASAGQVVPHFHLHLIPRHKNDGLKTQGMFGEESKQVNQQELQELAQKIFLS